MILPGSESDWKSGGKYDGLVAGIYRPLSRPADASPAPGSGAGGGGNGPRVMPCPGGRETPSDVAPQIVSEVLRSHGQPLDAEDRAFFEPRFGHELAQVRVHTGPEAAESAAAINALAYTVGRHVVFGAGRYEPRTSSGRHLLAHELTHAAQQAFALDHTSRLFVVPTSDPAERDAAAVARRMMASSTRTAPSMKGTEA